MKGLSIRKAATADIGRLVELRLLLQQHAEESNPSIWHITEEGKALLEKKIENELSNSNGHVMVAEIKGEIVGFIHGEVVHRVEYSPKTVGIISTAYVAAKHRKNGIGTSLVRRLCDIFGSEGVEDVTLRFIIGNKEAEGFWRKLGFKPLITTTKALLKELRDKR